MAETDDRIEQWAKPEQPTRQGWYQTVGAGNWMLYSLDEAGHWHAHVLNGESTSCEWGYIEQSGPVALVAAYR